MTSAANPSRKANGLPPTTGGASEGQGGKKTKTPVTGKKVHIRRLPPGITRDEVLAILGDDWKDGSGKVDWCDFASGKISKDPSKISQPAVYYLRVIKDDDVPALADTVQRANWQDARQTSNDPALVGPPYLEFSSTKVPPSKRRTDARQGTIDQDPEFQDFLASLTQAPVLPKDTEAPEQAASAADDVKENAKITSTPLVDFIREKKAQKAKEAAAAKSAKHSRQDSQGGKTKEGDFKKKGKETKADKADKEKEKEKSKEPVKLLTKKAAAQEAAEAAKTVAAQLTSKPAEEPTPKSRRANIAQAAKILQRDLGLSPGSAHRRARQNVAKAEAAAQAQAEASATSEEKNEPKEPDPPKSAPTGPKAQAGEGSRRSRGKAKAAATAAEGGKAKGSDAPTKPTTGPIILLKKDNTKKDKERERDKDKEKEKEEDKEKGKEKEKEKKREKEKEKEKERERDKEKEKEKEREKEKEKEDGTAPAGTGNTAPPTGPKSSAGKASGASKSNTQAQQKKAVSQLTPGATRAFVKHANPSQGVTEPLLKQAMETFGTVTFVEIDKRKGFAYVDFGDAESLRKAITASPISVAQGTVQVLERKDKKPTPAPAAAQPAPSEKTPTETPAPSTSSDRPKRGNRGRGRRGGGGGGGNTTVAPASTTAPASGGAEGTSSSTDPAAG